ncbi:hypothetical protein ANRL3_01571 [Anaerolineae bacterium]|nr:hypothetical protein ANRL3_01571 [Anaerolineae bacterium]
MIDPVENQLVALIRAGFVPLAGMPALNEVDWTTLVDYARRERVESLLYIALKNQGWLAQLPREIAERLRFMYLRTDVNNWRTFQMVEDLLAQFEREQIPLVLLKGAALAATLYPNPGLRGLGDLDILIRVEDRTRVDTLMQANGFTVLLELVDRFGDDFRSEKTFVRDDTWSISVDLHWHVINVPSYVRKVSVDWFWARTMEVPFGKFRAHVWNWDAQLLHLIEHFFIHHQMRGVRWSHDIALLLALHQSELHWDEILDAAHQFQVLPALNATLALIEGEWKVPVSASVRAQLDEPRLDWANRIGMIIATSERPHVRVLHDGLSYRSWRDKVAYLFYCFFPSRAYMRTRYRISHSILMPFYYLWRLFLGAWLLFKSVWSILVNAVRVMRQVRKG